jgi:hypothetical protein
MRSYQDLKINKKIIINMWKLKMACTIPLAPLAPLSQTNYTKA